MYCLYTTQLKLQISQVAVSCNSISQSSYSYPDNKRALGN